MTLVIENVNDDLAKAIRAMAKPFKAKVKKIKNREELTVNGFTPEFEKKLLQEVEETEKAYARGEIKSYKSVEEMHRDILNEI